MKHFNRYPLIIDPSGQVQLYLMLLYVMLHLSQATEFLQTHYVSKKIVTTSFLSGSFVRDLEVRILLIC